MPSLPALETLWLTGSPVDALPPQLRVKDLAIGGTRIDSLDDVPATVERLSLLRWGPDEGMRSLAGVGRLRKLRWLDLRDSGITDVERLVALDPIPILRVAPAVRRRLKSRQKAMLV